MAEGDGGREHPAVEPMAAEDAALLFADRADARLQIGALCFFEAEPLTDRHGRVRLATLRAHVAERLLAQPRFRQRLVPVWGDLAPPAWVDDADFDIDRHVVAARLPAPGDRAILAAFVDELLSRPMDTARPLWDMHVVDGVAPDPATGAETIALVLRAHHVMADGIALHAAASLLLDVEPRSTDPRPVAWTPRPTPGAFELATRALATRLGHQARLAGDLVVQLADPRRLPTTLGRAADLAGAIGSRPAAAPRLPITAPTGPRRAFAWDTFAMADVVAVKQLAGATVNDVVLAVATGALRRHLEAIGAFDAHAAEPRALVPVGASSSSGDPVRNRFSVTAVTLPIGTDDPLERVRLLHERMHGSRADGVPSLGAGLFAVVDLVPPTVLRHVAPWALAHQPLVNLAVSNVPGSRVPLYLRESRLIGLHPFINVVGNLGMIIGVLSHADDLGVGITVDPDVVGDPDVVLAHTRAAMDELVELTGAARAGGPEG